MAQVNISNEEVAEIVNALDLGVKIETMDNRLKVEQGNELSLGLETIAVNDANLTVKEVELNIKYIKLADGNIDIDVSPKIK